MKTCGDLMQDIRNELPHIADMVKLHWGHESFDVVVNRLILDSRGSHRKGFPPAVSAALLDLIERHARFHPQFTQPEQTVSKKGVHSATEWHS